MRDFIAIALFVNGLAISIYLFTEKRIDLKGFAGIVLAVLIGAVVITNLAYLRQLATSSGEARGPAVDIQQEVEQVETRAEEVKRVARELLDVSEEVKLLVQKVNMTNENIRGSVDRVDTLVLEAAAVKTQVDFANKQAQTAASAVKDAEINVTQLHDSVRATWRSMLESYYYAVMTRNIFPMPASIAAEIDKSLNALATFAYPDLQERNREIQRMNEAIRNSQRR